jgi:hypothetical protein
VVLPHFKQWLQTKHSHPATAILGHYELIAEWLGQEHRCHELKFL